MATYNFDSAGIEELKNALQGSMVAEKDYIRVLSEQAKQYLTDFIIMYLRHPDIYDATDIINGIQTEVTEKGFSIWIDPNSAPVSSTGARGGPIYTTDKAMLLEYGPGPVGEASDGTLAPLSGVKQNIFGMQYALSPGYEGHFYMYDAMMAFCLEHGIDHFEYGYDDNIFRVNA